MNLILECRRVGDVVVIKCSGRIVAGDEATLLHDRVKQYLVEGCDFVLNLAQVAFMDSSGMGTLVRLVANARNRGGDIKLCNVPDLVRRTFQLTNLTSVFQMHDSEDQAIAAFYNRPASTKPEAEDGRRRVLCVDDSVDVLAYLREVLRAAGYKPLTSANMHDALILVRAASVDLLVLGTKFSTDTNQAAFQKVNASLPTLPLQHEFSRQDAAEAGQTILREIRARLGA
jgi:anti-anti-sigma factor